MYSSYTDSDIEKFARIYHATQRQIIQEFEGRNIPEWENAPDEMQEQVRATIRYFIEQDGCSAAELHMYFVARKAEIGWKLGERDYEGKKTHPLMKPWNKLGNLDRMKNEISVTLLAGLMRIPMQLAMSFGEKRLILTGKQPTEDR